MFEVENKFKNASIPRTIRFTDSLFKQLNKIAKDNKISFNMLILQCCQYAIDNMKNDEND